MRFSPLFLFLLLLTGQRVASAQAVLLADSLARASHAAALSATSPRLVVDLASGSRNAYLMRVPDAALDYGYLATQLTYQTRCGLFVGAYLNHSYGPDQPALDDYEASLGYTHAGPIEWTIQYVHLFVPETSKLLRAGITDNVEGAVGRDFDLVYASLTADAFFGGTRDLILTWNISHAFSVPLSARDTLHITPTLELGTGTQRFYAAGLAHAVQAQVATTKKNGQPGKPKTVTTLETPDTAGFATTGYTLSLPFSLDSRRSSFAIIPAYLVPLHVPEWGSMAKVFYISAEFTRRFW